MALRRAAGSRSLWPGDTVSARRSRISTHKSYGNAEAVVDTEVGAGRPAVVPEEMIRRAAVVRPAAVARPAAARQAAARQAAAPAPVKLAAAAVLEAVPRKFLCGYIPDRSGMSANRSSQRFIRQWPYQLKFVHGRRNKVRQRSRAAVRRRCILRRWRTATLQLRQPLSIRHQSLFRRRRPRSPSVLPSHGVAARRVLLPVQQAVPLLQPEQRPQRDKTGGLRLRTGCRVRL